MRIKNLQVSNFRAIKKIAMEDLPDMVIVAGPNGCGKSCIFDAIRLLKSVYGNYKSYEIQDFFNEFQLNINQNVSITSLLQDPVAAGVIKVDIVLADEEKLWLTENLDNLLYNMIWRQVNPNYGTPLMSINHNPAMNTVNVGQVVSILNDKAPAVRNALSEDVFRGEVIIHPNGGIHLTPSPILELIFSTYDPEHIGIFDYHGPHRNYNREQLGGINLSIQTAETQSQHALYNYANKYNNIKTELASGWLKDVLAEKAGGEDKSYESLSKTLIELFQTFFPDKTFLGPQPTKSGNLLFNVQTANGSIHDLNDLSSGEKEVLYGYLRLRNSAPRNSVVLIDEPEMHLNPRLIQGLPQFYHKHLGRLVGNQLWLITHSDTLIRQSVGNEGFKVFHMQPAALIDGEHNQVSEVKLAEEIEQVVVDLVGDLAAYRPGAKVVIVEGGGDSEFDLNVIQRLFPEFYQEVNLISGGNKQRVREMHSILTNPSVRGVTTARFYSITDLDLDETPASLEGNVFTWDRYHIENYLLEPKYILKSMRILDLAGAQTLTETVILEQLKEIAATSLQTIVRIKMEKYVNQELRKCINTSINPYGNLTEEFERVVKSSEDKLVEVRSSILHRSSLDALKAEYTDGLRGDLESGAWIRNFRGRDILKQFINKHVKSGINYENFRNIIISTMRDDGFQPVGMADVIRLILGAGR